MFLETYYKHFKAKKRGLLSHLLTLSSQSSSASKENFKFTVFVYQLTDSYWKLLDTV